MVCDRRQLWSPLEHQSHLPRNNSQCKNLIYSDFSVLSQYFVAVCNISPILGESSFQKLYFVHQSGPIKQINSKAIIGTKLQSICSTPMVYV